MFKPDTIRINSKIYFGHDILLALMCFSMYFCKYIITKSAIKSMIYYLLTFYISIFILDIKNSLILSFLVPIMKFAN